MGALTDGGLNKIVRACFGYGLTAKKEYGFGDRVLGFLVLGRPIFLILTPLNAASAAVLGLGGYPSWSQCLLGFSVVAFAGAAVNTFNDYVDRERDEYIWQARPIPSGRVRPKEALVLAMILFAASLSLSWFFFNPLTFFILFLAVILGCSYSAYLRDRVGYLSLPPIVGLISLGGWAAFSPETLFSSWLPWFLYLLHFVWQVAHIMLRSLLTLVGKVDSGLRTEIPAFLFTPSARGGATIAVVSLSLTLVLSLLLPLLAELSVLYFILVLPAGIYALNSSLNFIRDVTNRGSGLKAFAAVSIFRLAIVVAILLDVLLSKI